MRQLHGNIEILSSRDIGFIGLCHGCGHIQVTIGTVISEMSRESFMSLNVAFNRINEELDARMQLFPDGEKVVLSTPAENLHLYLSRIEFAELLTIFNEGYAEILLRRELNEILG